MPPTSTPTGRVHLVLVPGFGGFDALGQLEYYAGITPLFRTWRARRAARTHAVLHYFDNLPTAGITTRASRLRSYLAKRIARGEFQVGEDVLALVGHSTGGLDIRRLLCDLAEQPEPIEVDGPRGEAFTVPAGDILGMVQRLVFLSVPQWGTNLADWLRQHALERTAAVASLRAGVRAAVELPAAETLQAWVAGSAGALTGADLLLAVQDALREIDTGPRDGPSRVAGAHEAAAQLQLWAQHIGADFSALDDLAVQPRAAGRSPAHFDAPRREAERAGWERAGIRTRSYATLGARPFRFEAGRPAPPWRLRRPWTWDGEAPAHGPGEGTDIVYRACYRACAGGPFASPDGVAPVARLLDAPQQQQALEPWDNDGIVNTASMCWPDGGDTLLVRGDHGDIIGHHRAMAARSGSGRTYHTYDLLGSGSGFTEQTLEQVWSGVFDFCVS